jgi:hypothetical protein
MDSSEYEFAERLDHESIVAASEKVAWTVGEIFRERAFDASKPIVPASWVGTDTLEFLDDRAQLALNHGRAFSYVHLLGNYEEFIPLHLSGMVEPDWHADRTRLRALLRFEEEELKHQQLFARAEDVLEASCGHGFGRYFDSAKVRVTALTDAILAHPPLARSLMLLALEWGTQRHYVESILDRTQDAGDALYADVLKAHWVEEAQHAKTDTLEVARLARGMSTAELRTAFDDVAAIGALVDATLVGQVEAEIATLAATTGRTLGGAETASLRDALVASLRAIIAGVSLAHPRFTRVARELSPEGAARLGIA